MTNRTQTTLLILPLALALTLSACSPKEKARIPPKVSGSEIVDISQHWVLDEPGGAVAVRSETLGRALLITRDKKGNLRTFDAWCPHGGCAVRPGQGEDLECPCHASHFSIDGDRLSGPSPIGLIEYAHEQQGDTLIVNFAKRTVRNEKGEIVEEG